MGCCLVDGRFSGVSHGILIGHICPEAADGGPIAAVRDGDTIIIDPLARTLELAIDDGELSARLETFSAAPLPSSIPAGSVLRKFARHVSSAHHGCVQ